MLKKFLCMVVVAMMLMQISAFAQITIDISDVANDIVTVSSTGDAGKVLSIMVVNPGYTRDDAVAGKDGAIQYFDSFVPESNDFGIPVKIMGNTGGKYTVFIKSSKGEEAAEFTFYNAAYKQKCIDDINAAVPGEDISECFERLVNVYGKAEDPAYTILGSKAVADAFLLQKAVLPEAILPADGDVVYDVINKSIVLAAYNKGNEELCFSEGSVLNPEIIGIDSSDELEDYESALSEDGRAYIRQSLMEGGYRNTEDIREKFENLVYRGVLLDFKNLGYGHIHSYLSEKYREVYEEAGFDIPTKENRAKYNYLLTLKDESLEELADKFNKYKEEKTDRPSGSGSKPGGSGVGGSVSVGSGVSYVAPESEEGTYAEKDDVVFADVSADHWAKPCVDYLASKGWINGYDDGSFKPENNITRAEYTKLVLTVFDIASGGQADFEDVSADAWYAPYVAAAQEKGIITGSDGKFFPESYLTRQEAAVIICRILGKTSSVIPEFTDTDAVAQYALPSVAYLSEIGVINGYGDNGFMPGGYITRAEISKIIYTLVEKGGIE